MLPGTDQRCCRTGDLHGLGPHYSGLDHQLVVALHPNDDATNRPMIVVDNRQHDAQIRRSVCLMRPWNPPDNARLSVEVDPLAYGTYACNEVCSR